MAEFRSETATVIVADDHPLFRSALRGAVEQVLDDATIIEADSAQAVQAAVATAPDADLCTLDLLQKRFIDTDGNIQNLLVDIAMTDAFLYRFSLEAE